MTLTKTGAIVTDIYNFAYKKHPHEKCECFFTPFIVKPTSPLGLLTSLFYHPYKKCATFPLGFGWIYKYIEILINTT